MEGHVVHSTARLSHNAGNVPTAATRPAKLDIEQEADQLGASGSGRAELAVRAERGQLRTTWGINAFAGMTPRRPAW